MKRTGNYAGQHGSALIWVVTLFFMFSMAALVVDVSRLYFIQQQMQSIANTAATVAVENTQTCGSIDNATSIQQGADEGALAAGWDQIGTIVVNDGLTEIDEVTGRWVFNPSVTPEQSNAVGVRYQRTVPMSLLLGSMTNIDLEARAVARKEVVVGMTAQASAASLDTNESELLALVISGILGLDGGAALSNIGFNAISGLLVDAEALVAELAGGTEIEDITSTDVTAVAVMEALRTVANVGGPAGALLDDLVAAAGANTNISLENIITAVGTGAIPPGAQVPVLAVVNSTVFNIGQALPDVISVNLGGSGVLGGVLSTLSAIPLVNTAANVGLELIIDEAPGIVFAPARRGSDGQWLGDLRGADITIRVSTDVAISLLAGVSLTIPLEVQLGASRVELVGASCASGLRDAASSNVRFDLDAETSALTIATDISGQVTATVPLLLTSITLPIASVGAQSSGSQFSSPSSFVTDPLSLNPTQGDQHAAVTMGNSANALSNALSGLLGGLSLDIQVLPGLPVGGLIINPLLSGIVGPLGGTLVPIVGGLVQALVEPLIAALGVSLGTAEVDLFMPNQGSTTLITGINWN